MAGWNLLALCAWAVHLYTALGAVAALLTVERTAAGDFRGAFIMMGVAVFIDSTDGPLARAVRIRDRIPGFDGALLDNVVDYSTYVLAPAFLMLRAGTLGGGREGLAVASFVMLASAYGFCRADAKTDDHYFLGFPSYWNLVALYLYCLALPATINDLIVVSLGILVFAPIKFIYPNRTEPMRPVTLALAAVWAVVTAAMLPAVPRPNPFMLYTSLAFIVYYFVMSLALYGHPARVAARRGS
jgi:phosphatidylcholine synthase